MSKKNSKKGNVGLLKESPAGLFTQMYIIPDSLEQSKPPDITSLHVHWTGEGLSCISVTVLDL